MKRESCIYYSDSQKALMWERWRHGDSFQTIAKLFDPSHSSARGFWLNQAKYVGQNDVDSAWR